MKKYFQCGLVILLPMIFTLMIVNFFINFLTQPFLELTQAILEKLQFFHQPAMITLASKGLILCILSGCVLLMGLFGRRFLLDLFFRLSDSLLHQLPFVNKIYKTCQDIVHSLFSSSQKFSKVVFAPFPNETSLSLGLVANETIPLRHSQQETEHWVSVFIPGTPNPSVGFLLMFKREQLLFVNMTVEEAMKCVVSCGIVMPDFEMTQPLEAYERQFFTQSDILSRERQLYEDSADLHKSAGSF